MKKQFGMPIIAAMLGFMSVVACNKVEFSKIPGPACQGSNLNCITQNGIDFFDYVITVDSEQLQTDILVISDNSGSMQPEQQQMANRISSLINRITRLDWRLGVITTDTCVRIDGAASGQPQDTCAANSPVPPQPQNAEYFQDGRLLPFPGLTTPYITKSTPNAVSLFGQVVQRPEVGSGDERGIWAAIRSFHRRGESDFFRNNAHLAVIVLSDEDERSDRGETPGRPMISGQDYAQDLVNSFNSLFPNKKSLTVHSIVIRSDVDPNTPGEQTDLLCFAQQDNQPGATASYGREYELASRLTGGYVGDICAADADYATQLATIGDVQVELTGSISLPCAPLDGNIEVLLSPSTPPSTATLEGNKLIFNPPLEPGRQVRVKFSCTSQQ